MYDTFYYRNIRNNFNKLASDNVKDFEGVERSEVTSELYAYENIITTAAGGKEMMFVLGIFVAVVILIIIGGLSLIDFIGRNLNR